MTLVRAFVMALTLTAAGCGRDSVTGPTPPGDDQVITGSVAAFGTARHAITLTRSGDLRVDLSWTNAGVDLDLYLAASSCAALYPLESCTILDASDVATGTSERITRSVLAGQSYAVFVDNLSVTEPQTYTLTIVVD